MNYRTKVHRSNLYDFLVQIRNLNIKWVWPEYHNIDVNAWEFTKIDWHDFTFGDGGLNKVSEYSMYLDYQLTTNKKFLQHCFDNKPVTITKKRYEELLRSEVLLLCSCTCNADNPGANDIVDGCWESYKTKRYEVDVR